MVYNLDMAFTEVGGFGYFQMLATFILMISRNSGMYIYYAFSYHVLPQHFLCMQDDATYASCSVESICSARQNDVALDYKVDTSYQYYIDNWYLSMDLLCVEPTTVGLIASTYSAAFALGGILFFLPDRLGRKKSLLMCMAASLLFQLGAIWSTTFLGKCIGFAGMGFF
jgi:MFS family permease